LRQRRSGWRDTIRGVPNLDLPVTMVSLIPRVLDRFKRHVSR